VEIDEEPSQRSPHRHQRTLRRARPECLTLADLGERRLAAEGTGAMSPGAVGLGPSLCGDLRSQPFHSEATRQGRRGRHPPLPLGGRLTVGTDDEPSQRSLDPHWRTLRRVRPECLVLSCSGGHGSNESRVNGPWTCSPQPPAGPAVSSRSHSTRSGRTQSATATRRGACRKNGRRTVSAQPAPASAGDVARVAGSPGSFDGRRAAVRS
jgi:hypothetical protein